MRQAMRRYRAVAVEGMQLLSTGQTVAQSDHSTSHVLTGTGGAVVNAATAISTGRK